MRRADVHVTLLITGLLIVGVIGGMIEAVGPYHLGWLVLNVGVWIYLAFFLALGLFLRVRGARR